MTGKTEPALDEVAQQLHAARVLCDDPVASRDLAAGHLYAALKLLQRHHGAEGSLPDWLRSTELPGLDKAARERLAAAANRLREPGWDEAPARRELAGHIRKLGHLVTDPPSTTRLRLWPRGLAILAVVGLVALYLQLRGTPPGTGPWRGEYYGQEEFAGTPTLVRDDAVEHDWGYKSPHPELPPERFSIRWDTCLVLDADAEPTFQLVSDDGSRLVVDGQKVIDNWGKHRVRSRGGSVPLSAGVHHLRVEYFEDAKTASISLRMTVTGDDPPSSVPAEMLRYPGDVLDTRDPCGAVAD